MGTQANLAQELDPDIVSRDFGCALAAEDAVSGHGSHTSLCLISRPKAYEKALAHSIYTYIRAGQSEQAMELCRSSHRPWRAAALQGYKLFDWAALCTRSSSYEYYPLTTSPSAKNFNMGDDNSMDQDSIAEVTGNKRRRLWKASCTAAALNVHIFYVTL